MVVLEKSCCVGYLMRDTLCEAEEWVGLVSKLWIDEANGYKTLVARNALVAPPANTNINSTNQPKHTIPSLRAFVL